MASEDWSIEAAQQPRPEDFGFDLDRALAAVVGLRATVPGDAFTADVLGTQRVGNGVVIRDGVVLTIGYLITEASTIWLTLSDGRVVPGHLLGYDGETGFGLVQALSRVDLPVLPLGDAAAVPIGERVVLAGAGGRTHAIAARIAARQEFAGYWEYLLDEAIFTSPPHPLWGGTALIGPSGNLIGIGSLQVEQGVEGESAEQLNMVVPVDILKPVLDDLLTIGRPNRPARPWLGFYAVESDDHVVVAGVATRGPAAAADLRTGDILLSIAGVELTGGLPGLFRRIWSLGFAGVEVPLTVYRDGRTLRVRIRSGDRDAFLKRPSLH